MLIFKSILKILYTIHFLFATWTITHTQMHAHKIHIHTIFAHILKYYVLAFKTCFFVYLLYYVCIHACMLRLYCYTVCAGCVFTVCIQNKLILFLFEFFCVMCAYTLSHVGVGSMQPAVFQWKSHPWKMLRVVLSAVHTDGVVVV